MDGKKSATERWDKAIDARTSRGLSKQAAVAATVREEPELHAEYLAEHNRRHGRERVADRLAPG